MKKVEFFSDTSIASLQLQVNTWLAQHKNISIMDTDMACISTPFESGHREEFAFYILYSIRRERTKESTMLQSEYSVPLETKDISTGLPGGEN